MANTREGIVTKLKNVLFAKQEPPIGELGRATGKWLMTQWRTAPYSPDELITRRGFTIYDTMQHDAQVKAALMTKKYAVLCKPWSVLPASEDEQDKKVADFCNYALNNLDNGLNNTLYNVLDAIAKGYSVSEKVWQIVEDDPDWDGYWTIAAIKHKDPANWTFDLDDYMNIKQMLLTVEGTNTNQQPIPKHKLVIYTYGGKYGQPWGESDLRAAYRHWWCKDFLIKWWQLFTEKYAMPTIVGYYKSGTPKKQQQDLLNILDKIASDTAIIIPEEVSEAIKEIFTSRDPRIMYESAVNYHDLGIAKAILGETLTLESGGRGGSFAMAKVHQETLLYQLVRLQEDMSRYVVRNQILKDLVQVNFGTKVKVPTFQFESLQTSDVKELADAFWKLTQVGMIAPDEEWTRDKLGWPKREAGTTSLPEMQNKQKEMQLKEAAKAAEIAPRNAEEAKPEQPKKAAGAEQQ